MSSSPGRGKRGRLADIYVIVMARIIPPHISGARIGASTNMNNLVKSLHQFLRFSFNTSIKRLLHLRYFTILNEATISKFLSPILKPRVWSAVVVIKSLLGHVSPVPQRWLSFDEGHQDRCREMRYLHFLGQFIYYFLEVISIEDYRRKPNQSVA